MCESDLSSHSNAIFIILKAIKTFPKVEFISFIYLYMNEHSHKHLKFLWVDFTLTSTHCNYYNYLSYLVKAQQTLV